MNPDNRDYEEPDDQYELEAPRSIFAALWFRVVLVVAVIGVIAAVAVPYVLEWMNPPPTSVTVKPDTPAGAMATAPTPTAPPPPAPAMPAPAKREPPGAAALAPPAAAPTAPQMGARPPAPAAEETRVPAAKSPPKAAAPRAAKAAAAMGGSYFVQVGAFKDGQQARKLAAKLRADKFRVAESTAGVSERSAVPAPPTASAPAGGDKYDVFVAGETVADLSAKLSAKGLSTTTTPTGLVVKPSLPLREAVALSKDLATEGLKVQVRRTPAAGAAAAPAGEAAGPLPSAPADPGDGLHRVRVGPFADRAAATEALQALRGKGYRDSFIARAGA
jgi:hypothetical protein